MDLLDIRTLILSYALMMAISGVGISFIGYRSADRESTIWWGGGCLAASAGVLLVALRGFVPLWATILAANHLVLLGTAFIWIGVRTFMGRSRFLLPIAMSSIIPCFGVYWYMSVDPSLINRSLLMMGSLAVYEFLIAREFFSGWRAVHKFAGGVFAFLGSVYLFWMLALVPLIDSTELMKVSVMFRILYLASIVFQILFISSLVLLLGDRLNEKLQRTKEKAEAASRAKSDFLATMSHEIRTPMCTILGLSELSMENHDRRASREYMSSIVAASKNLLGLVDDVLDYSKLDSGDSPLEFSEFSIAETVDHVLGLTVIPGLAKGLEVGAVISPDVPPVVLGDPQRLRQVLVNLVNNAVKFTAEGSVLLRVSVAGAQEKNVIIEFAVEDTGIGIAPEDREKVFDVFTQVDGTSTRKYGGVGLGLSICRRLVNLMNGNIRVQESDAGGSRFRVEVPFVSMAGDEHILSAIHGDGRRVMLFEESELFADHMSSMLEYRGFEVRVVRSGSGLLAELDDGIEVDLLLFESGGGNAFNSAVERILKTYENPPRLVPYFKEHVVKSINVMGRPALVPPLTGERILEAIAQAHDPEESTYEVPEMKSDSLVSGGGDGLMPVLLVDDSDVNRIVLTRMLSARNVEVKTARDGFEALEIVRENDFAVVFMDLQMPGMDGFEATRLILSEKGNAAPRIIALSADVTGHSRDRVIESGFSGYISKPVDLNELGVTLANAHVEWAARMKLPARSSLFSMLAPVIDIKAADEDYKGDEEFFCMQLSAFKVRIEEILPELKRLWETGNYEGLKSLLHSLRGTSALLKADLLRERLSVFEQSLDHPELQDAEREFELAVECLDEFSQFVAGVCRYKTGSG